MKRIIVFPAISENNAYIGNFYSLLSPEFEPISWHKLRRISNRDFLHFHWPESWSFSSGIYGIAAFFYILAIPLFKLLGFRTISTIHNLRPHDNSARGLYSCYWVWFWSSRFIHLSDSGRKEFLKEFPKYANRSHFIVPHSLYQTFHDDISSEKAKSYFNVDPTKKIMTIAGNIKPYKGIERAVECFIKKKDKHWIFIIAGFCEKHYSDHLSKLIEPFQDQIYFIPERLSCSKYEILLRASDIILIPYLQGFNSGVALHAASCMRPIFAKNTEIMNETNKNLGGKAIIFFEEEKFCDEFENTIKFFKQENISIDLSFYSNSRLKSAALQAFK